MKRIVIIGSAYPLRGGLAAFNERMAYGLQQMGHEVILYTFRLQYPGFLFPGKTQYSDDPPPEALDIRVKVNSVNPLNWLMVGNEIKALRPDLVICKFWLPFMGPCFGTMLRRIKRNGHSRIVSIIDNIIPHEKRPGDKAFASYFTGAVDAFVVMSRSVEEDMKAFVKAQPVAYIPHPVYDNFGDLVERNAACAELNLDPSKRYLLFFGFIRDYKGLDLLLRAMADQRVEALQGVRLIVAGEYYSNEDTYEGLIDELGIRDRLELHTDFISNEQVRYYFGAADLVVQPYKTATQSGISQMAYHFEKPMLVTAVGGLPEIVAHGKAGYVVPVAVEAIAEAIEDFFTQDRSEDFVPHVREGKKRFSWESMLGALLSNSEQIP